MATAYAGRKVDLFVQRIVDAMMAVPGLIIVLAIMAVLGSSLNNVIIAIVIGMLAPVVRTVRSQVLSVKEMEYVLAARAIGAASARVIVRHIMPNCLAIYLILATYYLGFAIILEASLSFLGVGVPPDVPSWGGMLTAAAQGHVTRAPWAGIFPGLAIFVACWGSTFSAMPFGTCWNPGSGTPVLSRGFSPVDDAGGSDVVEFGRPGTRVSPGRAERSARSSGPRTSVSLVAQAGLSPTASPHGRAPLSRLRTAARSR